MSIFFLVHWAIKRRGSMRGSCRGCWFKSNIKYYREYHMGGARLRLVSCLVSWVLVVLLIIISLLPLVLRFHDVYRLSISGYPSV